MRVEERGKLGNAVYAFSEDGSACLIYDPRTPRHWYNYLWNELGYCAQVSQTGHGRSYDLNEKADMCMLNGDSARFVYLRDDETNESWNIGRGPLNTPVEDYCCLHALAETVLASRRGGISASWRIFVPTDLYGEVWTMQIRNESGRPRTISLFPTVSFSLDGFAHPRYYEMYRSIETGFDPELNGIYCRSAHPFAPHPRYNGYLASSEKVIAFDGDLTAFCGPLSTVTNRDASSSALYQRPEVLIEGKDCTGSNGALFIPGAVLQHRLTLEAGEEKEIHLLFGVAESREEAVANARRYLNHEAVERAMREATRHGEEKYVSLSVHTPDEKVNRIMNTWVKKQVDFCIVGKKGVRDNLQIAVALLSYRPEKAKEEILECLRHQFRDGHAVLTWYPYDDTRYSDQPFWIIWAVCQLIKETGDASLLDLTIPWQDGGEATVMEHVKAAILCLLADKGSNGLVRIYFADWNDALNIPLEEQAESVMLSEQFCLALKEFERMMRWLDRPEEAAFALEANRSMKQAINRAAWDGDWYMRALAPTENIGSRASSGSKIYLNAQTWAILGDVADKEKLPRVLKAIDSMERDFGFPLNDPPYMRYDPMVGRMSGMLPGLFENGGVYCHASAFKILADCKCGRGDAALRTLKKIMPDSERNPSAQSGAEPYVFTNCYATHPKYITFSIEAESVRAAKTRLEQIELQLLNHLKRLGVQAESLDGKKRLQLMHGMMHMDEPQTPFLFDWKWLPSTGLSTKDFIAPSSLYFKDSHRFMIGKKMATVSFMNILASELDDRVLVDFLSMQTTQVITMHVQSLDHVEAIKLVQRKLSDINRSKIDEQKKAVRSGYDIDILPTEMNSYVDSLTELLKRLTSHAERLFLMTFTLLHTGDNRKGLKTVIDQAKGIAQEKLCQIIPLDYQQEEGFVSALPLGVNRVKIERTMTTSETAVFMPFITQELFHRGPGALYYGLNALSNNIIMAIRTWLNTPNGLILGKPGSGKSFAAKREIGNVMLTTDHDVMICDPEGEYHAEVEHFHGQVVRISPVSTDYINPLDINLNYSDGDEPIRLKSEFILSLCELVLDKESGVAAQQKSIIDRALQVIYKPYFADPVPENMPILGDLYDELRHMAEPEAGQVATALELYVTGSLNVFNHRTNVELNNRLVCFDIKQLGSNLKKLGMLIVQDQVWNRVTINRAKRKTTWFYADEFHLLLSDPQTAAYSVEIWKRFRKWGGIPTGVTQNVSDLLSFRQVQTIFENSEFIMLLRLSSDDSKLLAERLHISDHQLSHIAQASEGEGLLVFGNTIIPFIDRFPKDTELYRIMTTKPQEMIQEESA